MNKYLSLIMFTLGGFYFGLCVMSTWSFIDTLVLLFIFGFALMYNSKDSLS